jgi:hypothetical protein
MVLLTGAAVDIPGTAQPTPGLPHRHAWPTQLGASQWVPSQGGNTALALDAADGQPRWSEIGGEQMAVDGGLGHTETFTLTDAAVCEAVGVGVVCRDDTTGGPTMPVLMTGHDYPFNTSPNLTDGYAAVSAGIVAVTVAPLRSGAVTLRLMRIRGGATAAHARLAIGAGDGVFAVATGPLPGGATLILVRRPDLPDGPVLALRVPPPA